MSTPDVQFNDGLPSRAMRVDEFAAYLGISRSTAWAHVQAGTLPALKIGGSTRITPAIVARVMREGLATPNQKTSPSGARPRGRPRKVSQPDALS